MSKIKDLKDNIFELLNLVELQNKPLIAARALGELSKRPNTEPSVPKPGVIPVRRRTTPPRPMATLLKDIEKKKAEISKMINELNSSNSTVPGFGTPPPARRPSTGRPSTGRPPPSTGKPSTGRPPPPSTVAPGADPSSILSSFSKRLPTIDTMNVENCKDIMKFFIANYKNDKIKNLINDYSKEKRIASASIKACISTFTTLIPGTPGIDIDRITKHSDFVDYVNDKLLDQLKAQFP